MSCEKNLRLAIKENVTQYNYERGLEKLFIYRRLCCKPTGDLGLNHKVCSVIRLDTATKNVLK